MKRMLVGLLILIFMIQLVSAAEVCVVVDYGGEGDEEVDSECVDIDEGKNGYELLNELKVDVEWKDWGGTLGHSLCSINGIGYEPSVCWGDKGYWNLNLIENGEWYHVLDRGFDGDPHYEVRDGDFVGLAFGPDGSKPNMFKVNVTRVYVDGEKDTKASKGRGKVTDIFPGSELEFKIELENLYHSSTDIEIKDILIEATIEEILDGDDIQLDINEFDLADDRKTSEELRFTIPWEVEAKDRLLKIEVTAEDDAGIDYEIELTYDLEIEKESHKLKLMKAELNEESYRCGDNAVLELSVLNIGDKDEKVDLMIINEDLEIEINEDFELSNDVYEESTRYENKFNIWIPEDLEERTYPITLTLGYSGEEEIRNIDLIIGECEGAKESETKVGVQTGKVSKGEEINESKEEELKEITVINEKITENLPFILGIVLGVLVIIIIGLLLVFWVFKKSATLK